MKKIFTLIAGVAVTLGAVAGIPHASKSTATFKNISNPFSASASRATSCDTLVNVSLTIDTPVYYPFGGASVGYISGNGAVDGGGTKFPIRGITEEYTTTAGHHTTSAFVFFGDAIINAADSTKTIKAYIYDDSGTGLAFGEPVAPGAVLDSSTAVTLSTIAANVTALRPTVFSFVNQPTITSTNFFVDVRLPNTTGDTLIVLTNTGNTPYGRGWLELSAGGQQAFVSYDSLFGPQFGNFIVATTCAAAACPTISVPATQIGTSSSAVANATGGVAPYTYTWNTNPAQSNDTVTGLAANTSYSVTATDANGCTGTGTLRTAPNGINDIAGMTNLSIYPNPSTGVFTTAFSLEAAADVTISVVSMTGSKLYESTDKAVKEYNKTIDLSAIAAGVYIVNVKTATGSVNQRITVK